MCSLALGVIVCVLSSFVQVMCGVLQCFNLLILKFNNYLFFTCVNRTQFGSSNFVRAFLSVCLLLSLFLNDLHVWIVPCNFPSHPRCVSFICRVSVTRNLSFKSSSPRVYFSSCRLGVLTACTAKYVFFLQYHLRGSHIFRVISQSEIKLCQICVLIVIRSRFEVINPIQWMFCV